MEVSSAGERSRNRSRGRDEPDSYKGLSNLSGRNTGAGVGGPCATCGNPVKRSTSQNLEASQGRVYSTASPRAPARGEPAKLPNHVAASPCAAGRHASFGKSLVLALGLSLLSGSGTAQPAQDLAHVAPVEWGNWTYALDRLEEAQQDLMLVAPTEWGAFDAARIHREETRNALELAAAAEWAAYTAAGERRLAAEERLAIVASREKELYERRLAATDDPAAFRAVVETKMAVMEKVAPIEWAAYLSANLEAVQLEFGALQQAAPVEFRSWSDAKRQHGDAWRSLREAAPVELGEFDASGIEARAAAGMLRDLVPAAWATYKEGLDPAILRWIWP